MSPRPLKFRFYLDENFPAPAGKFLKSKGHNVLEATSKNESRSISDLQQIKFANRDDRILMALDRDFKTNSSLSMQIKKGHGVILIESSDPNSEKIISILKSLLVTISNTKLSGKICCASINKVKFMEPNEMQ